MSIEVKPKPILPQVLIKLDSPRKGEIFINGQQIPGVTAFRIEGDVQKDFPTVILQLAAWTVEFEGPAEVQMEVTALGGETDGNQEFQPGDQG